jgi:hypothetical protein
VMCVGFLRVAVELTHCSLFLGAERIVLLQ